MKITTRFTASFLTCCYTILGLRYIILPIKNKFSYFFLPCRDIFIPLFYHTYKIMYKLKNKTRWNYPFILFSRPVINKKSASIQSWIRPTKNFFPGNYSNGICLISTESANDKFRWKKGPSSSQKMAPLPISDVITRLIARSQHGIPYSQRQCACSECTCHSPACS